MRGAIIFVGFWRTQIPPPPPLTPQYLTILMTERERRAPLYFVGFWRPPNYAPHPQLDATILNYLIDREGRALPFVGFCPPPPPMITLDATILNYFNDRARGIGGGGWGIIFCRILAPPPFHRRHNI